MRLTMNRCHTRRCDNPTLAGFRRCPECMRGNTPNKKEEEEGKGEEE